MDEQNIAAVGQAKYQHMGKRTLWLFITERSTVPFLILIVAVAIIVSGGTGNGITVIFGQQVNLRLVGFWGLGVFAVVEGVMFLISWLLYITYKYMLDVDSLKVKRGILSQEQVAIPYRQIQDVTIMRSITYRLWGLSRLVILTAGHEDKDDGTGDSEGVLPALDKDVAEKLQAELLRRANVQKIVEAQHPDFQ